MDHVNINKVGASFHLEGFPDAVKVIKIEDHPQCRRFADLGLHSADLEFSASCLIAINQVPQDLRVIRQALWRSAVIHFIKCFGENNRFQLTIKEVLGDDKEGLEVFEYFLNLRNKHFIHDVNSYAQCTPGAVLNKEGDGCKISHIVNLTFVGETLEQDNYGNLSTLIERAKSWVTAEFDKLRRIISDDLEQEEYGALLKRESIKYKVPDVHEVKRGRKN